MTKYVPPKWLKDEHTEYMKKYSKNSKSPTKKPKSKSPTKKPKSKSPTKKPKSKSPTKKQKSKSPTKKQKSKSPTKKQKSKSPTKKQKTKNKKDVHIRTSLEKKVIDDLLKKYKEVRNKIKNKIPVGFDYNAEITDMELNRLLKKNTEIEKKLENMGYDLFNEYSY
jgi:hypothetical protein